MANSVPQTGKFLAQIFLMHQKTCARKLAQVTRSHYASFLIKKMVIAYALEKSNLQSIVQSPAEFHDRNLPEIELVLLYSCQFLAPFFVPEKMAPETPFTPTSFLSQETCQSERGFWRTSYRECCRADECPCPRYVVETRCSRP